MTDKELLDLAAKAAEIEIEWNIIIDQHHPFIAPKTQQERNWLGHEHTPWNPLSDDGDALRLAVKCVCVGYASVSACLQDDGSFLRTGDRVAAAIVLPLGTRDRCGLRGLRESR